MDTASSDSPCSYPRRRSKSPTIPRFTTIPGRWNHTQEETWFKRDPEKKNWRNQKKKKRFLQWKYGVFFCLTSIFSSYLRWHVRWSSMIYHPLEVGVKAPKGEWYSWVAQSGNSEKIITRTYAGKRHALQFIQKPIAVEASPSMECNSCPHGLGLMFASMYEFQSQAKHSCSAWHQFFWSRG